MTLRHGLWHPCCRVAIAFAILAATAPAPARAQPAWRPEKAVEIILPTAAGGANDNIARLIQKILQDNKLVPTPMLVMNKAGGNQTLASVYLRQHPKDAHFLLYSTSSVFTAQITGLVQQHYTDLTPIAMLMTEYSVFSVPADSPIRNVRDLINQLKADPQSIAFGIVSRGGSNHVALSQVVKSGGIDPRRLKMVVFRTNVESYLGLAGGHIGGVASSATAAFPFVQQGTARIIGIGAPERQPGPLAQVPTLREQGVESMLSTNWRGIFCAPGTSPAQAEYWDETITKMVATDDWKKPLDQNNLARHHLRSREFAKFLAAEYAVSKAVLTELGYAKVP